MESLFKLDSIHNISGASVDVDNYEKLLLEPYDHSDETKGKDFRNAVIQLYNHWLKLTKTEIQLSREFGQWIHTAIVLMDDIQDSSEMRRGIPSAHVIYGLDRTITAIDVYGYKFMNDKMLNRSAELRLMEISCAQHILQGQILDLFWRDHFICPSEEEYFNMIHRKTGYVIFALCAYMQSFSKINLNLKKLSLVFGMYFQLEDDYRALISKFHRESKGFCDDIREGKFTFPVVHAINSRPNDHRVLEILKMRTTDDAVKMKCLELLYEFGSMEYTRSKILHLKNLIIPQIEQLGCIDKFKKVFDLHNYDT